MDYGDGLSRADTTISVFDQTGRLILIGRDSDVQDDQGTSTTSLASGTFGKHDAFIGPAQLPASCPGQTRPTLSPSPATECCPRCSIRRSMPTPTNTNVRLEPIDSIARVVTDPLENFRSSPESHRQPDRRVSEQSYIDSTSPTSRYRPSSTPHGPVADGQREAIHAGRRVAVRFDHGTTSITSIPRSARRKPSPHDRFSTPRGRRPGRTTDFGTNGLVTGSFTPSCRALPAASSSTSSIWTWAAIHATQPSGVDPTIQSHTSLFLRPKSISFSTTTRIEPRSTIRPAHITGNTAAQLLSVFDSARRPPRPGILRGFSLSGDVNFRLAPGIFGLSRPCELFAAQSHRQQQRWPAPLGAVFGCNVGTGGNNIIMTFNRSTRGVWARRCRSTDTQITITLDTIFHQGNAARRVGDHDPANDQSPFRRQSAANSLDRMWSDFGRSGHRYRQRRRRPTPTFDLTLTGGTFTPGSIELAISAPD